MPEKPIIHGRDHRPGGEDPIPGIGGVALAVAYLWNIQGTLTVSSGITNTKVPWAHFQTTDSTVFGTDTSLSASSPYHNTAGDTYLYLAADGVYYASGYCVWPSGTYDQQMFVDNPGAQWMLDSEGNSSSDEEILSNSGAGIAGQFSLRSNRIFYVDSTTSPGITSMIVSQTSGSNKVLAEATMGVFYLGTAPDLTQIY